MSIRFSPGISTPIIRGIIAYRLTLALALLVAGIRADNTYDTLTLDNFAVLTKLLNRCSNFHKMFTFEMILPCDMS